MTDKTQPIGRVMLTNARLAFPNLFEPTTVNGEGKPRYNCSLIIPPDHPQIGEIKAAMLAVADAKWGAKAKANYAAAEKADKLALHDGNSKPYDGFADNLFVSAASQENVRPTVIDQDKSPLVERDGKPYAGCFVNASIEFWAQDNNFGKRVNAQLRGVQFLRDGDAFAAGRPADSDEFEAVTEGANAAEFA